MASHEIRSPPTLLSLTPEICNYIYKLSGCLTTRQVADHPVPIQDTVEGVPWTTTVPTCNEWCFPGRLGQDSKRQPFSIWINRNSERSALELSVRNTNDNKKLRKSFTLCSIGRGVPGPVHGWYHIDRIAQPPLTMVNKQLRAETLQVFYGAQAFMFTLFDRDTESVTLFKWLRTIGKTNASYIRNLKIVYRKKKDRRFIMKQLIPSMKKFGVRTEAKEGVVIAIRLGYPFCHCEGCIRNLLGEW